MLLKDLCTIKSSKRIFEYEYVLEGIPFVRGQEISDKSILKENNKFECYISKERYNEIKLKYGVPKIGDILITAVGTIGNLCYIDRNFDFYYKDGNLIQFTNFNSKLNSKFLYYFMQSPLFKKQLEYSLIGAVQKALTMDMLGKIELDLPDRKTQDKIVEILSNIDNQIERNNCMVKRLQDLATSTYSRWFNQFEFPNEDGLPYKSNGGKFVYNEGLKRNIPIGWEVKKIPNIFDFLEGPGITKDKYSNIGQNFINIKCLENNFINTNSCSKINSKYLNEYEKYQLKNEDILISTSGTLGTIGIVTKSNLPLLLNTSIIRFRPILDNSFSYMYSYLTTKYFKDLLYQAATGSIQKNVGPTHLENFNILVPTQYVLEKYNKTIYPFFKEICLINEQNIELNNLKCKLLPLLINGQLEI